MSNIERFKGITLVSELSKITFRAKKCQTMHQCYITNSAPALICLACNNCQVFCFSTASSFLNALASVAVEDLLKKKYTDMNDREAAKASKISGK